MSPTANLPKKKMSFINRKLDSGMGMAVAKRTYLRQIEDSETKRERWETWEEVLGKSVTSPDNGAKYFLHQSDDLWAILEGYSLDENDNLVEDATGNIIDL